MKRLVLFSFIIFMLVSLSGCDFFDPPEKNDFPPRPTQEGTMEYDQMVSATFRKPFDLKFGQTAQIEGTDIMITPQKIKTLPCAMCTVNYGFQATFEIRHNGQTDTVDISDRTATNLDGFSIIISKFTPEVDDSPTLPNPADYTLTLLVQDIPTTSPPPQITKPGFPMTLKLDGQSMVIKKELGFSSKDLKITAKKVTEDSRCPSHNGISVECYWPGQVVVLLEIQSGDDVPTSLKVSTIQPAIFDDVAIVLDKVDPPLQVKDRADGGVDTIPIAPSEYVFNFEIKKASDLPQKNQPQKPDPQKTMEQAQKIYDQAKTFFPENGVVFFVDNNDKKITALWLISMLRL